MTWMTVNVVQCEHAKLKTVQPSAQREVMVEDMAEDVAVAIMEGTWRNAALACKLPVGQNTAADDAVDDAEDDTVIAIKPILHLKFFIDKNFDLIIIK